MRPTASSLAEAPFAILNCPFDPVAGKHFMDHVPKGDIPVLEIQTMPPMRRMPINGDSRIADRIRKTFIAEAESFGGDIYLQTMGNIEFNAQLMVYKLPLGSYFPRVREWLYNAFDSMDPDKVYFIQFTSYDAIQLAFKFVTDWEEERGAIMRLGATYEGRILTLRAFKPRVKMNQYEAERMIKLERKSAKIGAEKAKAAKKLEKALAGPTVKSGKPYHTLQAGESITLYPDTGAFSTILNLRNVVYRYGTMTSKKFSISRNEDGSATIKRTL